MTTQTLSKNKFQTETETSIQQTEDFLLAKCSHIHPQKLGALKQVQTVLQVSATNLI